MAFDLILGTAGHIDHGKTSLTRALTGKETDRLPEEKKRGITIELGYAHLDLPPYRLGIVDVPGHEKFVRQMLAGATGMDLAMLVIAGDDSVKQQTREHLDILRLLDLPSGVIALTKCDLVEPDWLDLVEDEIHSLVKGTFLTDAPIVRTSAKTGEGIAELKSALETAAETATQSDRQNRLQGPFRMAIDRAFTIDGHGTVVTGSVSSGSLKVGDQINVEPGGISVRIRGLQNHDSSADEVHRGQRAAINLAGIHHNDIGRGHELCTTGHLVPAQLMTVDLNLLSTIHRPLKDRTRVRFHIGTAELFANVRLLDREEVEPGQQAPAQLFLSEPTVAIWNQPFVIRRQSPMETIGGGRIMHPNATRIRKPTTLDLEMISQMASKDPVERASASIFLMNRTDWTVDDLPRTAGVVETEKIYQSLLDTEKLIEISLSASRSAKVHRDRFIQLGERVIHSLARMHENNPLRYSHARQALDNEFAYLAQPELLAAVINQLRVDKKVNIKPGTIGLVGYGPKLSKGQRALIDQLVADLRGFGLKPPTVKELTQLAKKNRDSVPELLQLATENGQLVKVSDDLFYNQEIIEAAKNQLRDEIVKNDGLTMSEIRQLFDTSRKYAVPLCEYLDSIGFTMRDGDKRKLSPEHKSGIQS